MSRHDASVLRLALIEDDEEVRETLVDYFELLEEIDCVLAVDSMEHYTWQSRRLDPPDVVLMDIGLPGMNGIQATQLLKEKHPQVDVVMLTISDDSHRIFEALCAGATGYLLKNTPLKQMREQLLTLKEGGAPMSPQIALKVVQHFHPKQEPAEKPKSLLTDREKEVAMALVDGLSYKKTAERLHISLGTVYSHIKNIYKKLHINSKAELIKKSYSGEL